MWRAGITTNEGNTLAQNFETKDEADMWVLEQADTIGIKKSIVVNKDNLKERFIINWEKSDE